MKIIAKNASDFADLRTTDKGNCIYVDKTDYFHRLVTGVGRKMLFVTPQLADTKKGQFG